MMGKGRVRIKLNFAAVKIKGKKRQQSNMEGEHWKEGETYAEETLPS